MLIDSAIFGFSIHVTHVYNPVTCAVRRILPPTAMRPAHKAPLVRASVCRSLLKYACSLPMASPHAFWTTRNGIVRRYTLHSCTNLCIMSVHTAHQHFASTRISRTHKAPASGHAWRSVCATATGDDEERLRCCASTPCIHLTSFHRADRRIGAFLSERHMRCACDRGLFDKFEQPDEKFYKCGGSVLFRQHQRCEASMRIRTWGGRHAMNGQDAMR